MVFTDIEVKANFGTGSIKMRVISRTPLSDADRRYITSLRRDEAIKYGNVRGWKVIDMED